MTVARPTLAEIITRHVDDIDSTNPELLAKITSSPMNVFARASAGLAHGLYGYTDSLFLQSLPTTASGAYLDRWGSLLGVQRLQPTKARPVGRFVTAGSYTATAGDILRRGDGVLYEVVGDTTVASPYTDVNLIAVDAGADGSVLDGAALVITPAITGIDTAVVVQGDADGEDIEEDEAYRLRVLARLQTPPQGGSEADYIAWAKSVAGVGNAWVVDSSTSPYVDVRIVTNDPDDLEAGVQLVQDVQDYIDSVRPVTAIPTVNTATVTEQDITITGLTGASHADVEAALASFYASASIRVPGVTVYDTALIAAIQNVTGVISFTLTSPTGNPSYGTTEFPILGTVTWV